MNDKYKAQYAYKARNKDKVRAYNREYARKTASNVRYRYDRLKARAKRLGRKFRIAYEKYKAMIEAGCFYCGKSLMDGKGGNLDRVNNSNRNYTTLNVVPCCEDCNNLKNYQLTKDETKYVVGVLKRYRRKHGKEET